MSAPTATLAAAAPLTRTALADAVAARYADASRWARGFVRGKLLHDPATEAILALAPSCGTLGEVLDLGCGRGQLALALLLSGSASQVTGLDLNPAKIAEAEAASRGLPALFAAADLSEAELPAADTVLLVDLLYQMPEDAQFDLLGRVARAARRRVLIRAFDPDRGWRSAFAHVMERAGKAIRGDRAANRPVPIPTLDAALRGMGFATRVAPCWRGTPLPNVLLVAERGA